MASKKKSSKWNLDAVGKNNPGGKVSMASASKRHKAKKNALRFANNLGKRKAKDRPSEQKPATLKSMVGPKSAAKKSTGKKKAPAKKFVRKRPDLGKKSAPKSAAAKKPVSRFGNGTMVGGRQKFDKWQGKGSKWNRIVSKSRKDKSTRGNQWHTDQFMKAVRAVRRDNKALFDSEVAKLSQDPTAYNVKGHTINLGKSDILKAAIDKKFGELTSGATKRFSKNWSGEKLDTHGRKSVKAMKRRMKALNYTVQFGPDGKAK